MACWVSQYCYVFFESGSACIVAFPGVQFAGQTSPYSSVYWNAVTSLTNSSADLPTGRSPTVACLNIPFPSIIYVALKETPASGPSSMRHP